MEYDDLIEVYSDLAGLDSEETSLLRKALRFWANPDAENIWEKMYPGRRLFRRHMAAEIVRLRLEQIGEDDPSVMEDALEDVGQCCGAVPIKVAGGFELRVGGAVGMAVGSAFKTRGGKWAVKLHKGALDTDRQLEKAISVLEIETE